MTGNGAAVAACLPLDRPNFVLFFFVWWVVVVPGKRELEHTTTESCEWGRVGSALLLVLWFVIEGNPVPAGTGRDDQSEDERRHEWRMNSVCIPGRGCSFPTPHMGSRSP